MSRISQARVQALPDLISTEAFEFLLGTLPIAGAVPELTVKCLSTSIPGFSNEAYEANLHSHVRRFRGRKMYSRDLAATFLESYKSDTTTAFRSWHEYIVGTNSATSSGYIADYGINPDLVLYDMTGAEIDRISFFRFFLKESPDIQVTGESSTLMQMETTFSYDYWKSANTTIL